MFSVLKEVKQGMDKVRTGWKRRNVSQEIAETIWQHSKKLAKAVSIYAEHFPDIDVNKLVFMAKIHDFAEYKEEDYVPGEISLEEKFSREHAVIFELSQKLGVAGAYGYEVWKEYEEGKTQEAQIAKNLDKLEAAVQALEYEKLGYTNMENFFPYTLERLTDPCLKHILEILLQRKYPHISPYDQYYALLKCKGDEDIFDSMMTN